ncbi:class A beta-lactamase [Streptomonospora nanhaiensis]|uniref:class A beta-lactamase n=1 Tax=Streptomonospora nanhaiensis TaxID=1323731 RepID=UPI001C99E2F2|nr:class A beta-lactamase [Streptomonospora nanhaiensis]MBX9390886.1 class A beta-lactamase [Streptomonospora nanhaiensis]
MSVGTPAEPVRALPGAAAALALLSVLGCGAPEPDASAAEESAPPSAAPLDPAAYTPDLEELEKEYDARLGVYALDTGTGREVAFNADERFAYASTHKAFSAGAVLEANTMAELEEEVPIEAADLLPDSHSPVVSEHVGSTMTLLEICDAAVRFSDNSAANLLFEELGGPEGLDAALEELGDDVTQVDRVEPDLSEGRPGDDRDTSTPEAMATTLRAYTLGDVLPEDKRALLVDMLKRSRTGDALIRAGVPEGWEVGDKTGTAGYGARNDIAVVWPEEGGDPIVMAIMTGQDDPEDEPQDALVAAAAEVVAGALR